MKIAIDIPARVFALTQEGKGRREIAALGYPQLISRIYSHVCKNGQPAKASDYATLSATKPTEVEREENQDGKTITTRSAKIKTLDEALAYSKVDLSKFEVDRYIINSWEVTMGADKTATEKAETYTNYQVKVWLKPKTAKNLALDRFVDDIFSRKPLPKLPKPRKLKTQHLMAEIGLFDHHFGMLAWKAECGDDWDNTIAQKVYLRAVDYFLEKIGPLNLEQIVLPIGNDFFHINDASFQTPRSRNLLDVDSRLPKVYEAGLQAAYQAILRCAQVAPKVIIPWIPGNHSPELSYGLCQALRMAFLQSDHIEVDVSPNHRKYHRYGNTLIGYTHGDGEPVNTLPLNMLEDRPQDMADTDHHEWHIGHTHKKKETAFKVSHQERVAIVRVLSSLVAQDKYHHQKGYGKTGRAAECHIYDKQHGHYGYLTAGIAQLL